MRLAVIALVSGLALQVQGQVQGLPPQPARDTVRRVDAVGTATIRGHVIAADTGQPIAHAMVMLTFTPTAPPPRAAAPVSPPGQAGRGTLPANGFRPRQAVTDVQGGFEFSQLPAGTYRLAANPAQYSAQYLGMAYGATKPSGPGGDPGKSIALADGQVFDKADLALPRGAVIVGRLTDEAGMPLTGAQIFGLFMMPGSTRGLRMGRSVTTDDLGQFRLYGLQGGEYVVVAEARGMTFTPPGMAGPQQENDDARTGFLTTFYPGTLDEESAMHVRTRAAAETSGIEFRMMTGRMYRVSGFVTDSQGNPAPSAQVMLARRTAGSMGMSMSGSGTDAQGHFAMQNVAAGDYRIVVRLRQPQPGPQNSIDMGEVAVVPITVAGADLDNLAIVTTTGAAISGHVIFEPTPPSVQQATQLRVFAALADPAGAPGIPTPPPASVKSDLSFSMKGLIGEYLLRVQGTPQDWYVKSVTTGATDLTDTPHTFKTQDQVTVVISTRAAALEGTVTNAAGEPVGDAGIMMFAEDKASWRPNSLFTRRSMSSPKGTYRVAGLRPGRYYIVALPRERLNVPTATADAAYFEELAKGATTIVINEDETRTMDLKLATLEGGTD